MKKGFTLIELLAVIVILAIIALIVTPIVLSIINDVKISSAKSSMDNIEKALELYYFTNKSDDEITFSCEDGVCKTQNGDKLNVSGKLPSKGVITISKSGKITYDTVILDSYMCDKINNEFICSLASKNIVSSDGETIILDNPNSETLNNYKIYGDSIQETQPTPDVPVEVESVGNKTKNLVDIDKELRFVQTKRITVSLESGKTYCFSGELVGNVTVRLMAEDDTLITWRETLPFIVTPTKNVSYFWLYSNGYSALDSKDIEGGINNLQIEEGTEPTQYEPYGYKIPVKVSKKNELVVNDVSHVGASMKYTVKKGVITRESIIANVSTSYLIQTNAFDKIIGTNTLEAGTYIWGIINASGIDINNPYIQLLVNGETIDWYANTPITLEEQATIVYFRTDMTAYINGTFQQFEILLQKGTELTLPITTNIYLNEPLRKIDTYVDYIDFKNKKLIRNVGVLTLNGEETWEEKEGIYYLEEFIGVSSDKNLSISTHFIYNEENGFWIDNNNRINVKYEGIGSIEEFKEWLKNNNVTIYYPLKKSKIEEVEFPKLNLNEKYSYISVDTSLKPSKILLEYN